MCHFNENLDAIMCTSRSTQKHFASHLRGNLWLYLIILTCNKVYFFWNYCCRRLERRQNVINPFQVFAGWLVYMERRRGLVTSAVLFLFWLLIVISDVIPFYSIIILKVHLLFVCTMPKLIIMFTQNLIFCLRMF